MLDVVLRGFMRIVRRMHAMGMGGMGMMPGLRDGRMRNAWRLPGGDAPRARDALLRLRDVLCACARPYSRLPSFGLGRRELPSFP